MSTDSPNSFEPLPPDGVVKMRRWPLYAVICAGLLLVGVLVYSVNFAHNPEEEAAQTQKVDIKEQENPLIAGEGNGLALLLPVLRGLPLLKRSFQASRNR